MKACAHCGKPLVRKRIGGRLEDNGVFRRRKCSDKQCMSLGMRKDRPSRSAIGKRNIRLRKPSCERCDATEMLSVHHKDRNIYNNNPSNLETLCSSCHTSLHHEA